MTKEKHIRNKMEEAVDKVLQTGKGKYDRYKDALCSAFRTRFIEHKNEMMTNENISAWTKDQLGACAHALSQDKAQV